MGVKDVAVYGQTFPFKSSLLSTFGYGNNDLEDIVITDYDQRAQNLLLEQFKFKNNIDALIQSYVSVFQELEFVLSDVKTLTRLYTAAGVQLDNIAQYAGIERNGLNDDQFRQAILTQIVLNRSNGTFETVVLGVQFITNDSIADIQEFYPAKLHVSIGGPIPNRGTYYAIKSIMGAGVGLILVYFAPNQKILGFATEGGIPSKYDGLLKEDNYDSSATDGVLGELMVLTQIIIGG